MKRKPLYGDLKRAERQEMAYAGTADNEYLCEHARGKKYKSQGYNVTGDFLMSDAKLAKDFATIRKAHADIYHQIANEIPRKRR